MSILRDLREKAGLTQTELGQKIGAAQPQVARWEKEPSETDYRKIPLPKAIKIAGVLDCEISDLLPELRSKGLDALLRGAPPEVRNDVRNYAEYRLKQGP